MSNEQSQEIQGNKTEVTVRKSIRIHFVVISIFIITAIVMAFAILSESITSRRYDESLLAYQKYYDSTLVSQYEDIYTAIFLDALDQPIMAVEGYNRIREENDIMIFTFYKNEVTPLFEMYNVLDAVDHSAIYIYTDGIFTYGDSLNGSGEKIYYQARGTEVNEILTEYYDGSQFASYDPYGVDIGRMADEDALVDDNWDNSWITSFDGLDIEVGEDIDFIERFISNDKEYFLKWGTKADGSVFNEKDYEKEYSAFFKGVYGSDKYLNDFLDLSGATFNDGYSRFYFSPMLTMLPQATFQRQISRLIEKGSMSREEFLVWNFRFLEEPRNREELEYHPDPFLFLRNPLLLNGIEIGKEYSEELVRMLTKYAILTGKSDIFNKVNLLADLPASDVKEIIMGLNMQYLYYDIHDAALPYWYSEQMETQFEQEVTGRTAKEVIEIFLGFLDSMKKQIETEMTEAKALLIEEIKGRGEDFLYTLFDNGGTYDLLINRAGHEAEFIAYENPTVGYKNYGNEHDYTMQDKDLYYYEDVLAFLEEGTPLSEMPAWVRTYMNVDSYALYHATVGLSTEDPDPLIDVESFDFNYPFYDLYDIDGNHIPELIISSINQASAKTYYFLFTVNPDEIVCFAEEKCDRLYVDGSEGIYIADSIKGGGAWIDYFTFDGTSLILQEGEGVSEEYQETGDGTWDFVSAGNMGISEYLEQRNCRILGSDWDGEGMRVSKDLYSAIVTCLLENRRALY